MPGWEEIPVIEKEVRDYEHQLRLEISENENRKEFTFSERMDYARRLEQIEICEKYCVGGYLLFGMDST